MQFIKTYNKYICVCGALKKFYFLHLEISPFTKRIWDLDLSLIKAKKLLFQIIIEYQLQNHEAFLKVVAKFGLSLKPPQSNQVCPHPQYTQYKRRSLFFLFMLILCVATKSQKDHKLLRSTFILCSKKLAIKIWKVPH